MCATLVSKSTCSSWSGGSGAPSHSLVISNRLSPRIPGSILQRQSLSCPPESRIKAQAQPVQGAQPQVTASLVAVRAGQRGPGQLDHRGAQRLGRERGRLAPPQGPGGSLS